MPRRLVYREMYRLLVFHGRLVTRFSGFILYAEACVKLPLALLARVLALSWAGFWMVFFVAESVAWHTPVSMRCLGSARACSLSLWRWYRGAGR